MDRLIGTETEYGILVEGLGPNDWVAESTALVRHAPLPCFAGWNYKGEEPRRDLRGFTAATLATDPADAQFDVGPRPPVSREEERSDRVLVNGARLYNDHGHPEYSTPECRKLWDLVAHDRAGERILLAAADRRSRESGRAISLFKNNTDFHGASYGAHESYLMRRDVPGQTLIEALAPFMVSRPIYAGAGKCGVENDHSGPRDLFQLSQRADYLAVDASVDTLHNRPIVNTRDEPHATPARYRRLHVICGDANMSEYATALKVGATCLVLALLEMGLTPPVRLDAPVRAAKQISRDISLRQEVDRSGAPPISAIEIQRLYQQEADRRLRGMSEDSDWVLDAWDRTLSDLSEDPWRLADRLDWVAKHSLLDPFRQEEGLAWSDAHMQSLDLAYHNVNPEQGLYFGLVQSGAMQTLVSHGYVEAAQACAPEDTRAYLRGLFVRRFNQSIRSIGWNGVVYHHSGDDLLFDMNPLVDENVQVLNDEFSCAESLEDVAEILKRESGGKDSGEESTDVQA